MLKAFKNLFSCLKVDGANQGGGGDRSCGASEVPTTPKVVSTDVEATRADAIAILQFPRQELCAQLDTAHRYEVVTDVESAMKHAGKHPPGDYVLFQGDSGRIFLQAQKWVACAREDSHHCRKRC